MSRLAIRVIGALLVLTGTFGILTGFVFLAECFTVCDAGNRSPLAFVLLGIAVASVGLRLVLHRTVDNRTASEQIMDAARRAHRLSEAEQRDRMRHRNR